MARMGRRRSGLRTRAYVLAALPLLCMVVSIAAVWLFVARTQFASVQNDYSVRVDALAASVLRGLVDAETGFRGYAATGERFFLDPYGAAEREVPQHTAELRAVVANDPPQAARALLLDRLARERLDAFAHGVAKLDAGHRAEVLAELKTGSSKTAMDRVRSVVAQIQGDEQAVRARRSAALDADWRAFRWLIAVIALASTGVSLIVAYLLVRWVVDRLKLLEGKARRYSGGRVFGERLSGDDEIAQLDRAFHDMADVLHERDRELRRYSLLADTTRDAILFVDRETSAILDANQAARDLYGYSLDELVGMRMRDLRTADQDEEIASLLDAADRGGALVEAVALSKSGSTFPVEITARTAEFEGRSVVLEVVRDITERQRANETLLRALDQAVAASQFKSQFVATMSHEIRTPMSGVIGMTELLLTTDLGSTERKYAEMIHESAETLLRIINDILDFSKMEAGKLELEQITFALAPVVEGVVELLGTGAKSDDVTLLTYIAPEVPKLLHGDPSRLRQVLFNVVGNAVKFTCRGSVVVLVERVEERGGTVVLRFEVRDSGIGMSPEVLASLFQPFQQGDSSTTRKFGGTGLGLSIAKRIVELMNGEIGAISEPGIGTIVTFTAAFGARSLIAPAPHVQESLEGVRLLVIDDDAAVREMLVRYAASWGITASVAGDADAGFELLRAAAARGRPYDVAMIDYVLPGMNGLELGRKVRNDPRLSATKLLMITAFDAVVRRDLSEQWGFVGFVAKPIRQSPIHDAIVGALHAAAPPVPSEEPTVSVSVRAAPAPSSARRLLVVDDNTITRSLAERQLATLGYDVSTASDGAEAVRRAAAERFDAILMDCSMPQMDGFAATRAIREAERASGDHVTIIAMTANALDRDRDRCIAAGMDDYLAKPIRLDRLRTALAHWLPATEPVP